MTRDVVSYLAVAAGGALGSVLRFWLSNLVQHRAGAAFPWGTLAVNVLGSFLIGFLFCAMLDGAKFAASAHWRNFLLAGVLGGFTTFSAFSLQTVELLRAGTLWLALMNVLGSVTLCVCAAALGWWIGGELAA